APQLMHSSVMTVAINASFRSNEGPSPSLAKVLLGDNIVLRSRRTVNEIHAPRTSRNCRPRSRRAKAPTSFGTGRDSRADVGAEGAMRGWWAGMVVAVLAFATAQSVGAGAALVDVDETEFLEESDADVPIDPG